MPNSDGALQLMSRLHQQGAWERWAWRAPDGKLERDCAGSKEFGRRRSAVGCKCRPAT